MEASLLGDQSRDLTNRFLKWNATLSTVLKVMMGVWIVMELLILSFLIAHVDVFNIPTYIFSYGNLAALFLGLILIAVIQFIPKIGKPEVGSTAATIEYSVKWIGAILVLVLYLLAAFVHLSAFIWYFFAIKGLVGLPYTLNIILLVFAGLLSACEFLGFAILGGIFLYLGFYRENSRKLIDNFLSGYRSGDCEEV